MLWCVSVICLVVLFLFWNCVIVCWVWFCWSVWVVMFWFFLVLLIGVCWWFVWLGIWVYFWVLGWKIVVVCLLCDRCWVVWCCWVWCLVFSCCCVFFLIVCSCSCVICWVGVVWWLGLCIVLLWLFLMLVGCWFGLCGLVYVVCVINGCWFLWVRFFFFWNFWSCMNDIIVLLCNFLCFMSWLLVEYVDYLCRFRKELMYVFLLWSDCDWW